VLADKIPDLVRVAVQRGIAVLVFADDRLNLDASGQLKETCRMAVAELAKAGATVSFVPSIHNKTLCVDTSVIVEGSFNWLSAVRDSRSHNQRQESFIMYCGAGVEKMIIEAVRAVAPAH
jgi:hypothetical protein